MAKFALIGLAGYIAPKHLKAIKDVGGELVCALDPHDSVGIIDSYYPDADFFTEPERFDRHLDKLRRSGQGVDYVSICSPNYLHDAHIRMALRNGCDVICEKPLVLNSKNVPALIELEKETGKRVNVIMQLRLHPCMEILKELAKDGIQDIYLTYHTPRGKWYQYSWKGDIEKSGGLVTNIGIHFFDMIAQALGKPDDFIGISYGSDAEAGILFFGDTKLHWDLAINTKQAVRSLVVDCFKIDMNKGFTDLHTESYKRIINGDGFTMESTIPALEIVEQIR